MLGRPNHALFDLDSSWWGVFVLMSRLMIAGGNIEIMMAIVLYDDRIAGLRRALELGITIRVNCDWAARQQRLDSVVFLDRGKLWWLENSSRKSVFVIFLFDIMWLIINTCTTRLNARELLISYDHLHFVHTRSSIDKGLLAVSLLFQSLIEREVLDLHSDRVLICRLDLQCVLLFRHWWCLILLSLLSCCTHGLKQFEIFLVAKVNLDVLLCWYRLINVFSWDQFEGLNKRLCLAFIGIWGQSV